MKTENILIIGAGKTGTHLYHALKSIKTYKVKFSFHIKLLDTRLKKHVGWADIIFITTRDKDIHKITQVLTHIDDLRHKYIYHTSGSENSELLKALAKRHAITGSFHPVQTFESRAMSNSKKLSNIYIAIEGSDKAITKAKAIVRSFNSKAIVLSKEQKIIHHICCVFASGFLVSHLSLIDKLSSLNFSDKKKSEIHINVFKKHNFFGIYKPLAEQTFNNIIKKGFKDSLTGPIERNDTLTLSKHLEALKKFSPEILQYYKILSSESSKLALKKNKLSKSDYKNINKILKRY